MWLPVLPLLLMHYRKLLIDTVLQILGIYLDAVSAVASVTYSDKGPAILNQFMRYQIWKKKLVRFTKYGQILFFNLQSKH